MHILGEQQRHRDRTRGNRKHFGLTTEDPDQQRQKEWLRSGWKLQSPNDLFIYFSPWFPHYNKFLRPQSTRTRRPWREAVWRNPCQSWTTTNTMCFHIWRRTAGGFPSTTCCTKSHPLMAKQETDSAWVLKQLIVHSWSVLLIKYALQACCWFLSSILLVIIRSYDIQEAAHAVMFNLVTFLKTLIQILNMCC